RAGAGQRQTAEHSGVHLVQRGTPRLRHRRSLSAGRNRGLRAGDTGGPARLPDQRRVRGRPVDHLRRGSRKRRALRAGVSGQEASELESPKTPMTTSTRNPLLETWATPFEAPPFATIKPEHFAAAF